LRLSIRRETFTHCRARCLHSGMVQPLDCWPHLLLGLVNAALTPSQIVALTVPINQVASSQAVVGSQLAQTHPMILGVSTLLELQHHLQHHLLLPRPRQHHHLLMHPTQCLEWILSCICLNGLGLMWQQSANNGWGPRVSLLCRSPHQMSTSLVTLGGRGISQ